MKNNNTENFDNDELLSESDYTPGVTWRMVLMVIISSLFGCWLIVITLWRWLAS